MRTQSNALLGCYLPALFQVGLVADNVLLGLFADEFFDFLEPGPHIFERTPVGDIIGDDNAISSSVVATCNSLEAVLASRIPLC